MRKHVLYARSTAWREMILQADQLMAAPAFRIYKRTPRTTSGFLAGPGGELAFAKRVRSRSWLRGAIERLRGSRAARTLRGAKLLSERAFSHPEPMAAMELRSFGAVRASYVISRALANAEYLSAFALGPDGALARDYRRRKRISDAVAREVRRLHETGLFTRDLQETNILCEEAHGGILVHFVDLEDFRALRRVPWRLRLSNLVHLDRSVGRFLSRAARLSFLYSYLGNPPRRAEARRIVRELLDLRAALDRRSLRRRPRAEDRPQPSTRDAARAAR